MRVRRNVGRVQRFAGGIIDGNHGSGRGIPFLKTEEALQTDDYTRRLRVCVTITDARQAPARSDRVVDAATEPPAVLLELLREDRVQERVGATVERQHEDRENLRNQKNCSEIHFI